VAGFFGKFFLFTAAASKGMFVLVFIAVLNATISLYYYLQIVKAVFINKNETPIPKLIPNTYERLALSICFIGIVVVGFISAIYDYIQNTVG
jgi:NADH-quinone oxidoreductase subunit N